ncbi:hypothetical protein F2P81_017043 [Scophthalmus maximus]|uniref:Uncharacterized protein n=1 Tax=Scophthalmus maximus TaxID=52904 RepID=A0A6A4SIZ4_SCOMX|nr:hypothetical protein F2P81_017043 [Scophthalmus maximus]
MNKQNHLELDSTRAKDSELYLPVIPPTADPAPLQRFLAYSTREEMDSAAQVVAVAVTVVVVVVVKRWCPLRHSSLRTPNTLPLQLWHNAGGTKLWS